MAMELEDRCPICLDSWDDVAYVIPCLHQFCFMCIMQWAETKPECPLCKESVLSIKHSLWGDEGFDEPVTPLSAASPVIGDQGEGAPGHQAEPSPAAAQPQPVEMMPAASQGWSPTPGPALSSSPEGDNVGDWPSTSAAVLLGGPSSTPSALLPIPQEQQEPQEEAAPGASSASRGRKRSLGEAMAEELPQGTLRRRASSPESSSPAAKRPPHQ